MNEASVVFVDTASSVSAVALVRGGELAALEMLTPRAPAEQAAQAVEDLLARAGLAVADLAAVGVSVGPGSYTGVRSGLALATGLALVDDLMVVSIGSLEALASLAPPSARRVLALSRAQRGSAYRQSFVREDGGELRTGPAADLVELSQLGELTADCVCVEGTDVRTALGESAPTRALPPERIVWVDAATRAGAGARLAWQRWSKGGGCRGSQVRPCYVGGSGAVAGPAHDPVQRR